MARIKEAVIGSFSGGLGGVIGSSWKGIKYVRSRPGKVSNPCTERQQDHRQKIAVTMKFLRPMAAFIRIGFKNYSERMNPFNAAMSWNYHNALQGFYPDNSVDYAKALVTHGNLPPASNQASASADPGTILFTWDDNSMEIGASGSDRTLLAVYNPGKEQAVMVNEPGTRGDRLQAVSVPNSFSGDMVHCYIGFISEDGGEVSDSRYAGAVVVA